MSPSEPRIVATGTAWIGSGVRSIESALDDLFRGAEHEVQITAYSISSGADLLLDSLEMCLARGVSVTMIVNQLGEQPLVVLKKLRKMAAQYPHYNLLDFNGPNNTNLHAKLVVADRNQALIGSSNLSRRGLLTNHELGVVVVGHAASVAAKAIDELSRSQYTARFHASDPNIS